jgi:hypothetical protein
VRLPRPWYSQDERDEDRRGTERSKTFARGMRQNAAKDGVTPDDSWSPGRVPSYWQVRKQERDSREKNRRLRDGHDPDRARALARASQQDLARDRQEREQRRQERRSR